MAMRTGFMCLQRFTTSIGPGRQILISLPLQMPERFARLLVMNTALGTGDDQLTKGFIDWRSGGFLN
jgi:hypothetical protein